MRFATDVSPRPNYVFATSGMIVGFRYPALNLRTTDMGARCGLAGEARPGLTAPRPEQNRRMLSCRSGKEDIHACDELGCFRPQAVIGIQCSSVRLAPDPLKGASLMKRG